MHRFTTSYHEFISLVCINTPKGVHSLSFYKNLAHDSQRILSKVLAVAVAWFNTISFVDISYIAMCMKGL